MPIDTFSILHGLQRYLPTACLSGATEVNGGWCSLGSDSVASMLDMPLPISRKHGSAFWMSIHLPVTATLGAQLLLVAADSPSPAMHYARWRVKADVPSSQQFLEQNVYGKILQAEYMVKMGEAYRSDKMVCDKIGPKIRRWHRKLSEVACCVEIHEAVENL